MLQRTAPCVTAPASTAAFPPTMQVPRRTPRSLSSGSLDLMRARFLVSIASLLIGSISAVFAESPHEIALRIISSAPSPVYSPTARTAEELDRAAGFSSDAQLNKFMLATSVPEEIRVCYAMHLLVGRLLLAHDLSDSKRANDYQDDIRRDHEVLAKYLRQLNERTR